MSARTRYARGLTVIPSARDRRIARQLVADAFEGLATCDLCGRSDDHDHAADGWGVPDLVDDDNEGGVDVDDDELAHAETDFLTPAELEAYYAGPDWDRDNARDLATYAEVAETTAFMRAYLRRVGRSQSGDCPAGGGHVADDEHRGACGECGARPAECVDCGGWVAMRTPNGLCADCALAHLEGVALSHLEAS